MGTDNDKLIEVPNVTARPNGEANELLKTARCVDSIQQLQASFPDGKRHFNYRGPDGKQTELLQDHIEKLRGGVRKKFNLCFDAASSQARTAMDVYRDQKTTYGDRAIGWVIESVGRVKDPGQDLKTLVDTTNRAVSSGRSKTAAADKFEEAANLLIEAASSSARAELLIRAYKEKMVSRGNLIVTGLTVVKKACEITLEVGAVVLSGGAATAAIAGKAAMGATDAVAVPLMYGDSDKIEWGKLASVAIDVVFSKCKAAEKAEKFIFARLMNSSLGEILIKKVGRAAVHKYISKFIAEKGIDIFEKVIEGLGQKPKEMNWKTFLEKFFFTKLSQIFLNVALPNSIPKNVREEIAKSTGKKIGELVKD